MATGLAAWGLFAAHTALSQRETRLDEQLAFRRLWSDWALAVSYFLDARHPVPPERRTERVWPEWTATVTGFQQIVLQKVQELQIRPHQFWRSLRAQPFLRARGQPHPLSTDDPGRARLLALGFHVLGGPAPYLILWLGALCALPLFVWTAWEAFASGRAVAGALFLTLLALSPFVVEGLAFPRSAIGFYLLGALLLVPLATYATRAGPLALRGLIARTLAAGALFGVFANCRSGVLFLLPGFAIALVRASSRALRGEGQPTARHAAARLAVSGGIVVLVVLPYLLLRPAQRHDTWFAIWEGLGDFDRRYGHAWSDEAAEAAVRAAGGPAGYGTEAQAVLRAQVMRHVREDPRWFAGILLRRLLATITLRKLWPRAGDDGLWMTRSLSPNEGFMDKYWSYTTTVDFVGLGRWRGEVAIAVLVAPTVGLLALAFWPGPGRASARAGAFVVACLAAATLPIPVLVSTAAGQETQAFALVFLAGAAFLVEALGRLALARVRRPRAET